MDRAAPDPRAACRPLRDLTGFDAARFKREEIGTHRPLHGPDGQYLGHEWSRWIYDTLDGEIDAWLGGRPAAAILDVGCASGVTAARWAAAGHRVTGLDLVPPGDARSGVEFRQGDVRALAAPTPARYDLIHGSRVLNFLTMDEIGRFLGFAAAALVPDGLLALRLFVMDPDRLLARVRGAPSTPLLAGMLLHDAAALGAAMHLHGFAALDAFAGAFELGLLAGRHDAPASGAEAQAT